MAGKRLIAPETNTPRGWIKGQPKPFLAQHSRRLRGKPLYEVEPETGCWVWQRMRDRDGYGRLKDKGRSLRAHQYFYEREHGALPGVGLQIDHLCRNRACVNPEHLEIVTPAENQRRSPNTKLAEAQVREIRASDDTPTDLARRFGVSRQTIVAIVEGRLWRLGGLVSSGGEE